MAVYEPAEDRSTASGVIAFYAVMALFPIFLIYQSLGALGVIPLFIGGGFGATGAVFSLLMTIPFLMMLLFRRPRRQAYFILSFVILWVGVTLIIIVNITFPPPYLVNSAALGEVTRLHMGSMVYWYVLFLSGLFWGHFSRRYAQVIIFVFVFISIIMLANAQLIKMLFHPGNTEGASTYQQIARSIAIIGMLALAYVRSWAATFIIYILLIASLFFIGARSEFAGTLALAPIVFLLSCKDIRARVILISLLILCGTIFLLVFAHQIPEWMSGSRQGGLLELSDDSSWLARQRLLEIGVQAIMDSPFFGDFAGEITHGGVGGYIHNILSAWRQYGIIPFLLFIGLLVYGTVDAADAVFRRGENDSIAKLSLYFNLTSLLLLLAAKGVFWPVVAFAWGLSAQMAGRPLGARSIMRPSRRKVRAVEAGLLS